MSKYKYLKPLALGGVFCLSILSLTNISYADNIAVGRYLSISDVPKADQKQLLRQEVQVHFPQSISTIGQAMKFLLQFSGYQLEKTNRMSTLAQSMLRQSLPEVDRNFGPLSLDKALMTLAGEPFYLLVDPIHKLVAFRVKPHYQVLFERTLIKE